MADIVKKLTITSKVEGAAQTQGDLKGIATAYDQVADSAKKTAAATDTIVKGGLSIENAYKRQTLALDEAARAQDRIMKATKVADSALKQGVITQTEHAQRLDLINSHYTKATAATEQFTNQSKLARYELINLSRQFQDVGVSLASGQSFFTVLIQQGSQIADVFASSQGTIRGFLGQMATGAAAVLTPIRALTAGVAGLGAFVVTMGQSWAAGQGQIQRGLMGTARASGVTLADVNRIARESSSALGLSMTEARETAVIFAQTGKIFSDEITRANKSVMDFARLTGVDAVDAARKLADILKDPVAGYDKLVVSVGNYDGKIRNLIVRLEAAGQSQKAQQIISAEVEKTTAGVGETYTALERTLQRLGTTWDAIKNKAKSGANELLGGNTQDADRLVDLTKQLNQMQADLQTRISRGGTSLFSRDDPKDIERLRDRISEVAREVGELNARINQVKSNITEGPFRKLAEEADTVVRAMTPQIEQIEKLQEAIKKLNPQIAEAFPEGAGTGDVQDFLKKQRQSGAGTQPNQFMGASAEQIQAANNALEIQLRLLNDGVAASASQNTQILKITDAYAGLSIQAGLALSAGKDQLAVAQAVTVAEQLKAQQAANYNALLLQGKTAEEAMLLAKQQTAIAQAQINSAAQLTLLGLRDQEAVARSTTGQERLRQQEIAKTNELIRQGVDAQLAGQVARQQTAIAQAQINSAAQLTLLGLRDQEAVARSTTDQERQRQQEIAKTNELIRQGVDSQLAGQVARQETVNVRARESQAADQLHQQELAQQDAMQATNALQKQRLVDMQAEVDLARQEYNWMEFIRHSLQDAGGSFLFLAQGNQPTKIGRFEINPEVISANLAGAAWNSGITYGMGGAQSANAQGLQQIVDSVFKRGGNIMDAITRVTRTGPISSDTSGIIGQLVELLPDAQRASVIERELADLRTQPMTLAREQLIKQLTDSLDQLKQSTDSLNDTISLSGLYGSDPRTSHIGYRAFAGGGIMTPWGSVPLRQYADGGVASSPQMAMFGEGSTPEAYVPVPSGRIPVEVRGGGNTNIDARIIIQGNVDENAMDRIKLTQLQQAQRLAKMTRAGAQ